MTKKIMHLTMKEVMANTDRLLQTQEPAVALLLINGARTKNPEIFETLKMCIPFGMLVTEVTL